MWVGVIIRTHKLLKIKGRFQKCQSHLSYLQQVMLSMWLFYTRSHWTCPATACLTTERTRLTFVFQATFKIILPTSCCSLAEDTEVSAALPPDKGCETPQLILNTHHQKFIFFNFILFFLPISTHTFWVVLSVFSFGNNKWKFHYTILFCTTNNLIWSLRLNS